MGLSPERSLDAPGEHPEQREERGSGDDVGQERLEPDYLRLDLILDKGEIAVDGLRCGILCIGRRLLLGECLHSLDPATGLHGAAW